MATRADHGRTRAGCANLRPVIVGPTAAALSDSAPFAVGLIPIWMTLGAAIASSTVDNLVGWLGGPMLIGGTSHLASVSMLDVGAGALAVVVTALKINLRVVAYSAVIAPRMACQPVWFRWVASAMLVDQSFATVTNHLDLADRQPGFDGTTLSVRSRCGRSSSPASAPAFCSGYSFRTRGNSPSAACSCSWA